MTERPIEDQSDLIKELYSDLTVVKPREGLFFKKKKRKLFYSNEVEEVLNTYSGKITCVCFLLSYRLCVDFGEYTLRIFIRMVDISNLPPHLPCDVSDDLWRPVWFVPFCFLNSCISHSIVLPE